MEVTIEKIRCVEHNELVLVKDALIVSLGENGRNYVIGPGALKQIESAPKREKTPCSPGEQGLEFYQLSFYQNAVVRGPLVFSIGEHSQVLLPFVEAQLLHR